jgi:hypothetical protein
VLDEWKEPFEEQLFKEFGYNGLIGQRRIESGEAFLA